ncbi:hypothetical protein KBD61_06290 [Patescibacteria group bacterium]|nr:hypothetical protein [Patescibacteria group bacterium]MBP9710596.1 hypothetical protein [Patescibacteria group bacterium]
MLTDSLHSLGLTKTEAAVYLFLLESGVSTPAHIAKGTGILRTNAYHVLQSLEAQDLIEPQTVGKRQSYLARDPQALFHTIEAKREAITRILPDLRGLYSTQKNKPKIQFYDGREQVKQVYLRSLEGKEIFATGSIKSLDKNFDTFFRDYVKEVKKRNIIIHDLPTHASREETGPFTQSVLKGLYDPKYLPAKHDDLPTDLLIWNDCIAHITLEEPFFATVITSPLLAKTMRTLLQILHERL